MAPTPSGQEVRMKPDEIIVSKTDTIGKIQYVNKTFCDISGFHESELLGQPHSMIRNDFMPRCVFKLLWDTIAKGNEIFAYVVNECKNGDHYWVYAHVTPSYDLNNQIDGYHSMRRAPRDEVIKKTIMPLYAELRAMEDAEPNRKEGMMKAYDHLLSILAKKGVEYDEFVIGL